MSVSKLESLPNEILIEILEKYINGLDLVKAFRFQLNQRFDILIQQCRRFRFDFVRCHQYDFCLSMGILRAYSANIEELALSEQNAPGQIHAFLKFFPTFNLFNRLRKLYLCFDVEAIEPRLLQDALHALMTTSLHTISLKIIKAQTLPTFNYIMIELFRVTTLRKLAIISSTDQNEIYWDSLKNFSSNIEYLAMKGIFCDFENIKSLFRCVSGLKYIDIDLTVARYDWRSTGKKSAELPLPPMSKLHTLIAKINGDARSIQDQMDKLFKSMPSLRRLELSTEEPTVNMNIWEMLLKSSLSKLTHFNLECFQHRLHDTEISAMLETMDIPFWMGKKNYNIVLKEYADTRSRQSCLHSFKNLTNKDSNAWRVLPRREQNGLLCPTNQISKLVLSSHSNSLLRNDYLENVTDLIVEEMNKNLLELLIEHLNLSHIQHLDISSLKDTASHVSSLFSYVKSLTSSKNTAPNVFSLLSHMKSLTSLRINTHQLTNPQLAPLNDHNKLIFIDISVGQERFNEKIISTLAKIFPYVEHLVIRASDLKSVPLLQVHLPKLRSLTFTNDELESKQYDEEYDQKMFNISIGRSTKFLFQRENQWLTVWLDQAAFQDAFWRSFGARSNNSPHNDDENVSRLSLQSRRSRKYVRKFAGS